MQLAVRGNPQGIVWLEEGESARLSSSPRSLKPLAQEADISATIAPPSVWHSNLPPPATICGDLA